MKRETLIYTAVAAGLVLVAYIIFAYLPFSRQLHARRAILAVKAKELTEAQQLVARYPEFRARAIRIQMEAQRLERRLPTRPHVPDLLKDITQAATETNIKEFQFVPQPPVKRDGYWEQPVRMNVMCNYHALGMFLTRLASLPRLVSARDIKITGRDKTGRNEPILAEMTLVTYVLQPR